MQCQSSRCWLYPIGEHRWPWQKYRAYSRVKSTVQSVPIVLSEITELRNFHNLKFEIVQRIALSTLRQELYLFWVLTFVIFLT